MVTNKLIKKHSGNVLRRIIVNIVRYFFLLSLSYVVLYQIAYMASQAFKPENEIYDPSIVWVPKTFTLENIKAAWEQLDYLPKLMTTVLIPVGSGLLEVFTCSLVAYGLARFKFRENKIIFGLVLLTILVPPQMIIIPTYLNYAHLDFVGILGLIGKITGVDIRPNILDTPLTFYLPALFGVGLRSGFFIFIYRQFFAKMPRELEEAAWIDGANPLRTFLSIIIPSAGVAITTVLIFSIIWHYNDYYLCAMYFNENYPLAVSLSNVGATSSLGGTDYIRVIRMAASLLFILPVLIVYMILQKRFIQNIDRVGIVG